MAKEGEEGRQPSRRASMKWRASMLWPREVAKEQKKMSVKEAKKRLREAEKEEAAHKREEERMKRKAEAAEKEEAAHKREEERMKRKAEAEAEAKKTKQTKVNQSFCAKALARIAPVLSKLELSTSASNFSQVPAHVKGDAFSSKNGLTKMQIYAISKFDGSSATYFSSEDLDDALQKARKALKDMMKSMKK